MVHMPFDPSPSIVGRELLGPQLGRTVTQGFPDFDPVAYLDRAGAKAQSVQENILSDSSVLPDELQSSLLGHTFDIPISMQTFVAHATDDAQVNNAGEGI